MNKEFKEFLSSIEDRKLSLNEEENLKGGNEKDPDDRPNYVLCGFDIGECHDKLCGVNVDACGPTVNPFLKVTCRTQS